MLWPLTVNCTRQIEGLMDKKSRTWFCFAWKLGIERSLLCDPLDCPWLCLLFVLCLCDPLTYYQVSLPWFPLSYTVFLLSASLGITKGTQYFYQIPSQLGLVERGVFCCSFGSSPEWLNRENIFNIYKVVRSSIKAGCFLPFQMDRDFGGELCCDFSAFL